MAKYEILKSFYASEKWVKFRLLVITQRGLRCEHCGEMVKSLPELTLHHIKELTPENVHDPLISLNPENVMVVHHECHNKIHNRFGYQSQKRVYIVFGPPMAGKKTYVREYMQRGDIVIDMDSLYGAVSMLPSYDKPDNLLSNVMGIHNLLIDNVRTRYGKWHSAWIIGGYADKYKREKLANELGAEIIFCEVSMTECLSRLEQDKDRKFRKSEWREYIKKWYQTYAP